VLLLSDPEGLSDRQRAERRLFVMRLQQFTGPVMAKGLEDTVFYRYFPLVSVNEVGGNPQRFGVSRDFFHSKNAARRREWPNSLLATSTHDTKRGEDVRARINVLSEIPGEWYRVLRSWHRMNLSHKSQLGGIDAPDTNEEYLLYQTLVGTWPLEPMDERQRKEYVDRIQQYMEKAVREAKRNSSWISPNAEYERVVRNFVDAVLDSTPQNQFLQEFCSFQSRVARAGMSNSLAQVLLKIASPGIPDFYQGTEIWNFSLVDPDNRKPVDYDLRHKMLDQLDSALRECPAADLVSKLTADPDSGAIKMYVTSRALNFRREHKELFSRGAYLPLRTAGNRQRHVIAFARTLGNDSVLAIAGRFFWTLGNEVHWPVGNDCWEDAIVVLRKGVVSRSFRDVFTERRIEAEVRNGRLALPAAQIFSHLPIALLAGEKEKDND